MATLFDLVNSIKTKSAGPFAMAIDLYFDEDVYKRVCESGNITREVVAEAYNIPVKDIYDVYEINQVNTIKIGMKRPVPAGDISDTDLTVAQQHVPLLSIDI